MSSGIGFWGTKSAAAAQTYAALIKSFPSLVGYWRLNDTTSTAVDSSGNGLNGTYRLTYAQSQSALITSDATAASTAFGGVVDTPNAGWVDLGNPAALQLSTGTMLFWFTGNNGLSGAANFNFLCGKQSAYSVLANDSTGTIGFEDPGAATFRDSGVLTPTNATAFVAYTFQSGVTNGSKLYLNGSLILTSTMTNLDQTQNVGVAATAIAPQVQATKSQYEEVAIFNAVLSQSDISAIYAAGTT